MKYGLTKNFIDGRFVDSTVEQINILSPLDGSTIGTVPLSGQAELEMAVEAARKALPDWSALTFKTRSEVLYNYRQLLKQRREELAEINHVENGKTIDEARAGIDKALELTEFACSLPQLVSGRTQEVSRGVTCSTERLPVGIVASITPFNFPVMVPHWTVPNAIALGNAMILKPSELTPVCARVMAEIWKEAGLPDGIFNIVNGGRAAVEAICDHPEIRAISFVGSTAVAQQVYRRATNQLKAVLALGGAKNHLVLVPDAHPDMAARDILASFTGMSGQRCMAASVLICVGDVDHILDRVCDGARKLVPGRDLPPLITDQALRRIRDYLAEAEKDGARILVDGRSFPADGPESGYYIGPSIIDFRGGGGMPPEEVFGPTLEILGAQNLGEALALQQASPFGNAASIFTQNGRTAQDAVRRFSAGMCGVNIGIPVPREPFSFGGWNASKFGTGDITGESSIDFWTRLRKVTVKWNPQDKMDWMS
jgi:malonate-semialdehyde dehydrogenase (acetylating)/methylmalonate-semialdehyde dehydrogenase